MNNQTQETFGSDAQLEKHAKEYYGLTLNQFKLMCDEAYKRYEGQFSNSVDKALAVESFYEGFKIGCTNPHQWQGLTDAENEAIIQSIWEWGNDFPYDEYRICIEQALKEKNS